jgi:ABC-type dipeptide/oligopeptide/nickel transport system permease component
MVLRYFIKRLLYFFPVILMVSFLVFIMIRLIPGDPARTIAGIMASEEDVERIRIQLGLKEPIHIQFIKWVSNILKGDLGISIRTNRPVTLEIFSRLPNTIELTIVGLFIAIIIGIPIGIFAAIKRGELSDTLLSIFALSGVSIPVFWMGLVLIYVFSLSLGILPVGERGGPLWTIEGLSHIILPSITIAAPSAGVFARITRSSMIEVLEQEYIRTAKAKGLKMNIIIFRHCIRNVLVQLITIIGMQFGYLLGGAIVTETVFAWPGIGRLLVDAIISRDYPLVQGIVLVYSILFISINLFIDLIYGIIDPRIRYE